MNQTDPKQVVRHFISDVVNTGSYDLIERFVAPDIIDHNAAPPQDQGITGYIEHLRGVRTTFPDFTLTIEDQFADGEYVTTRVTGRGTHQGAWLGITPLGTPVSVSGINIDRVVNGKIVEHWGEANTVGMLLQLGVTLAPPDAPVT